jgi:hypothetical protein
MIVRRTLVALSIGAVLAAAPATTLAGSAPRGMTPAEYRALMIRSEALNKLYGNAVTRLSTKDFVALWNAGASRMTPSEFNALVVRSEGLNQYARQIAGQASTMARTASSSGSSFAWGDFGIGVAAALGLVLLMGGLAVAVRTGTRGRVSVHS